MNVIANRLQAEVPVPEREAPSSATQTGVEIAFGSLLAPLLQPEPAPVPAESGTETLPAAPATVEGQGALAAAERAIVPAGAPLIGAGTARPLFQMVSGAAPPTPAAPLATDSDAAQVHVSPQTQVLQQPVPAPTSQTAATAEAPAPQPSAATSPPAQAQTPGAETPPEGTPPVAGEVARTGMPAEGQPSQPNAASPQQATPPEPQQGLPVQSGGARAPAPEELVRGAAPPDAVTTAVAAPAVAAPEDEAGSVPSPRAAARPVAPEEAAPLESETASVRLEDVPVHRRPGARRHTDVREASLLREATPAASTVESAAARIPEAAPAARPAEPLQPGPAMGAEAAPEGIAGADVLLAETTAEGGDSSEGVLEAVNGKAGAETPSFAGGGQQHSGQESRRAPSAPVPQPDGSSTAPALVSGGSGTNVPDSGKDVRPEAAAPEAPQPLLTGSETAPPLLSDASVAPTFEGPPATFSPDADPSVAVPPSASPPESAAASSRAETARAPLSAALMERWQSDLQGLVTELRTEAGGWQRLRLRLDDDGSTVTLRARREDDRVAVTVAFSDPALRQTAQASAERLHTALEAQLGQQVAFSFDGGGDGAQQHASTDDRHAPTLFSAPTSESDRKTPLPRQSPTANREWIG